MELLKLKRQDWEEGYPEEMLDMIEELVNEHGGKVILYKCVCCDNWSAHLDALPGLVLPVSNSDRQTTESWIKENGFTIVGEIINGTINYYN